MERDPERRKLREMKERELEARVLEDVRRATVEGQLRAQQADEEGRILAEIERRDKAQLRHRLELQKLCEESEELRVLREKLRMAQTTFERSRQRDEAAMIERKERE